MKKRKNTVIKNLVSLLLVLINILSKVCGCFFINASEEELCELGDHLYIYDNYSINYRIDGCWNNNYNVRIIIENTSEEIIHNWQLEYEYKDEIYNPYNASINFYNEKVFVLNNEYNQDIKPNEKVEFGYIATYSEKIYIPECFLLTSEEEIVKSTDYTLNFTLEEAYDEKEVYKINIANNSNSDLNDWIIEFKSNYEICNIWNAEISFKDNNKYIVRNPDYNQNIGSFCDYSFYIVVNKTSWSYVKI